MDAGVVAIDGTKIAADASFFANRRREESGWPRLLAQTAEEIVDSGRGRGEMSGTPSREAWRADARAVGWWPGSTRTGSGRVWRSWIAQKARDYETRMAERAAKEAELGRKLTGPKPSDGRGAACQGASGEHDRSALADHRHRLRGVLQGYNAQAAATADQIVLAAEVTVTTNDQPHFVPMATAVTENLAEAGHHDGVGAFVADAGYWTAANGTVDVGAEVLIATRKTAWRKADKPDDDKLAVLARVNRGELSQRQAGEILGVSYTWVRDMTKRYFGRDGQRITRTAATRARGVDPGDRTTRTAARSPNVPPETSSPSPHAGSTPCSPTSAAKRPTRRSRARAMDAKLAEPDNAERYQQQAAQPSSRCVEVLR